MGTKAETPKCENCGEALAGRQRRFCSRACRDAPRSFWARVDRSGGPVSCWPWCGARDRYGYGQLRRGYRLLKAHRIAFEEQNGYLPRVVRHTCDNPPCCNPAHLLPGTQRQNLGDAAERGRMPSGGDHWNGKKSHCSNGHAYDEANTRWRDGKRECRACQREIQRRRRARARGSPMP